jgi:RimK family alpha-L-glutamate ligase
MAFYLTAARPTATNAELVLAHRRLGAEAYLAAPSEVAARVRPGDSVLLRLDVRPALDGVEPGIAELDRVAGGVRVLNRPGPLLVSHDKLATAVTLGLHRVPHPRTAHVGEVDPQPSIEPPVVVKPRFGSWGRDVFVCRTEGELRDCLRHVRKRRWFQSQGALVQELIPCQGRDLRLVVARGQVVGAIERTAAPGEWRTNISLGGRRRSAVPPVDARLVAEEAAAAVGCDLIGVDLVPGRDGEWLVLELNAAVEMTGEYSLDGTDVFAEIAAVLSGDGASLRVYAARADEPERQHGHLAPAIGLVEARG